MIQNGINYQRNVYLHKSTTNQSFLDMHYYLKDIGIKNNAFFLVLYDPDLAQIDPRDPRLNIIMQKKVLRECMCNYWYFIREVVRIPTQGGEIGGGARYKLHRGNLAMNYGFVLNWCMFVEFPRQNFKSISAVTWYLWVFNFGSTNSEFMFINKSHSDSKLNLLRLKELREALPAYLRMDQAMGINGKPLKAKDSVETLEHLTNGNRIKTLASATNKVKANSLGRGCTQPFQWYDEHAFIPHVDIVYQSATPAYKTASQNARDNNKPYGILITTTPGDLTTEQGMESYLTKEHATKFQEQFYDLSLPQLQDILSKNEESPFVYIRFTYQQLGRDEKWFKEICVLMKKDWSAIRREVLLEWSAASDNSPFKKEDLNIVKSLIKEPISNILIRGYPMEIYGVFDPRYTPIIGVDVAGGFMKDSSAITVVDSKTTNVTACMNCSYINTDDLAAVIYELVTRYMPRAVVNVERNGGFGASVLAKLINSDIKHNLYYEIKERVLEERFNGTTVSKKKQMCKVYGLDNSKDIRLKLMDILKNRMTYHKDKFISGILYNELQGLEVTKNGKIDHSSQTHDDQIFSYLLALYVWYEGKDIKQKFGIDKSELKTDEDLEQAIVSIESSEDISIVEELSTSDDENVQKQLEVLEKAKSKSYEEWRLEQKAKDTKAMEALLASNPLARDAFMRQNHTDESGISVSSIIDLPDDVFTKFYD